MPKSEDKVSKNTQVKRGSGHLGGRPKGSPNRATKTLRELSESLGVNPFQVLLHFASGDWKALGYEKEFIERHGKEFTNYDYVIDPAVRAKCAAEATKYLEPQRKAIEHTGKDGGPIETRDLTAISDDELKTRIAAHLERRPK